MLWLFTPGANFRPNWRASVSTEGIILFRIVQTLSKIDMEALQFGLKFAQGVNSHKKVNLINSGQNDSDFIYKYIKKLRSYLRTKRKFQKSTLNSISCRKKKVICLSLWLADIFFMEIQIWRVENQLETQEVPLKKCKETEFLYFEI